MNIISNPVPNLKISKTYGKIADQGLTYNQSGVTYNDIRYFFSGLYDNSDVVPIISIAKNNYPT